MFPKSGVMRSRKLGEGIYSKKVRDRLLEDGAITNEEEGFMKGYLEEDFDDENIDDEDSFNKHETPYFEGMF